jgi:hypothetical protein
MGRPLFSLGVAEWKDTIQLGRIVKNTILHEQTQKPG